MPQDEKPYPENIGKRFALPNVTTFGELFTAAEPWDWDEKAERDARKSNPYFRKDHVGGVMMNPDAPPMRDSRCGRDTALIGTYCGLRPHGRGSLRVTPSEATIAAIRGGTIDCGAADTFSFEIIDHGEGKSLVVAQHSLIIGSLWLGYIDSNSVPVGSLPNGLAPAGAR